jgi:DNA-binding MarR family transcriptional regulator
LESRIWTAWYVFFGFCVLAAYSAQRFLQAMLNRVLQELESQKGKVQEAQKSARVARQDAASARQLAEDLADDVSEPESLAMRASFLPEPLSAEETSVIVAFQEAPASQRWTRRSIAGLAADTGLSESQVERSLIHLIERGLVEKRTIADRVRWRLTPVGRRWKSSVSAAKP